MEYALAPDTLSPLEDRAGVDGLGDLQHRRRVLAESLHPLKALHGHNGKWDDKRKQLLEACKIRARMSLTETGQKITESLVESMGYADEQYTRFLDDGIVGAVEYLNLDMELTELGERIRSREIELLCYNSEAKLSR